MKRKINSKYVTAAIIVAAVLSLAVIGNVINPSAPKRESGVLRATFFDCGQADCTLLEGDEGYILIDTGGADYEKIIGKLSKIGVKRLECLVITHFDSDHGMGAADFIERLAPKTILVPYATETERETFIYKQIKESNAELTEAVNGQRYYMLGAELHILAPNQSVYTDGNEASIVIKCTYGKNSFLFAADATAAAEKVMLSKYVDELKCDVLKVAHHGSGSSSGEEFLTTVKPKYAVISCGISSYGFPAEETVKRLEAVGARILVTWRQGDVIIESNGKNLTVIEN